MTQNRYEFTLIGGDRRLCELASLLQAYGQDVNICHSGCDKQISGVKYCKSFEKSIFDCDILVLPMPISKDKVHIFIKDNDVTVSIKDVLECAKRGNVKYIFGGNLCSEIHDIAHQVGVEIIDYSMSEEFLQDNAYATAEGGIMMAMENIDTTIRSCNVLVSGSGRIANHLVNLLLPIGANVTVCARNTEFLDKAEALGCHAVKISDTEKFREAVSDSMIIFNTVPHRIFRKEHIENNNRSTYIELASCPGGIDLVSARIAGMKVIFAPSLPGRYCPVSAGEYIFRSINQILKDRGIFS